jgi:hypothetical protein
VQCEICNAEVTATSLALVEVEHAELPADTSGVATLTGQICVPCWTGLERPPSSLLYRGRLLTLEDIYPLDMRPIAGADLERRAAADRVVVADELTRAEALKVKLNRYAVLTFNDPYSGDSVTVDPGSSRYQLRASDESCRLIFQHPPDVGIPLGRQSPTPAIKQNRREPGRPTWRAAQRHLGLARGVPVLLLVAALAGRN